MLPEHIALSGTDFHFKNQQQVYHGKVRDVYDIGDKLIIITSDRISAFDHILPRPIPWKGQVLNQIAAHFLEAVKDICPVWLEECPDPNVSVGKKCQGIPIEMVVRGYLTGHAWRTYKSGERVLCGVQMEEGMRENQQFTSPILTPTTKASEGHDEDISSDSLIKRGIVSKDLWEDMARLAFRLFERGTSIAAEQGLILVDTKYEFGLFEGKLILMDEIHTPDSSRYFERANYLEHFNNNTSPTQLSKEFVREWLMAHGFQGKEGQLMPEMPDLFVWTISERYIDLYERITGKPFIKSDSGIPVRQRIASNLSKYL